MDNIMTRFINALNKKRASFNKDDKGFTLIELLVVVIIIGVLAAIAIPVYIGVQNSAKDSAAGSDLTNAKIAVVAYYTATGAMPTAITTAVLGNYGYTQSGTTAVTDVSTPAATATAFCLKTTSASTKDFWITQSGSPVGTKPAGCSA
jgi:prepilin-type N-terminal cleavage/methylation domain-containing protein